MGLFNLKDDKLVVDPDLFVIPEFHAIWEKDKSKNKENAQKILSYIFFYCDYNSPYAIYPNREKHTLLVKDFLKGNEGLVIGFEVEDAITRYRAFQETPTMRLLESAQQACNNLSDYFMNIDFTERDDTGKPIYQAKDVATNLKAVGGIVESLDKTLEMVKKQVTTAVKVRGGGAVGDYER